MLYLEVKFIIFTLSTLKSMYALIVVPLDLSLSLAIIKFTHSNKNNHQNPEVCVSHNI